MTPNTPLEPAAENRGGSAARPLCALRADPREVTVPNGIPPSFAQVYRCLQLTALLG
jgi:hypothetical protein